MYLSIEEIYQLYLKSNKVSIDSRTIGQQDLFFAIKGENFDGNKFANKAIEQGANAAIIDDVSLSKKNSKFVLVKNVMKTLQKLANYHRNQFKIPVLSITGSNGKTTTKELIASILSKAHNVHYTKGNFNNHIGVPLTLLDMPLSTEIAVIEMGANHLHEIEFLCEIANPTHGLITNIGKAHLEGFGDLEGVKKAKGELFDFLRAHDGIVFINEKESILESISKNITKIGYKAVANLKEKGYQYKLLSASPQIEFQYLNSDDEIINISSSLYGVYNFQNIMAATTIGRYFKVSNEGIAQAILDYIPTNNRSQIINFQKNIIYLDAYNANPSSMSAALLNFSLLETERKIVILGDMLELGKYSRIEHEKIYELAKSLNFEKIILVGQEFEEIDTPNHFENVEQLKKWWLHEKLTDYHVLLKGSRGIKLEKMLN